MRAAWILGGLLIAAAADSPAQDIREASRRAAADRARAEQERHLAEERILTDAEALRDEVERLETETAGLEAELDALTARIRELEGERDALEQDWSERELQFEEISGNIRVAARELDAILRQSLITVFASDRLARLRPLLRAGYFPDIEDVTTMADLYLDEIVRSGQVRRWPSWPFVGRGGEEETGEVLSFGTFGAIYRTGGEVGFLQHPPDQTKLFALPRTPSWETRRRLARYLDGKDDAVTIDLSGGAALRRITHRPTLWNQVRAGGPIVWPILAIGMVALGIAIERMLFLGRVHGRTDRIMTAVGDRASRGDWDACERLLEDPENRKSPVVTVIRAGLAGRGEKREALESILQEAILRELPRLERFLSVLSIFGAVAPLLGLLGTVTGMIDTFRVITVHGTGDPKLMSGGISEALITTELGLAVAIPIMLLHTFLSRRVDHIVGDMEEKAVALTNIIQKRRRED